MKKTKKRMNRSRKYSKLETALGVFSVASIAASLFMGYNRITGNVVSSGSDFSMLSIGGVALFILGILGVFLVAKK